MLNPVIAGGVAHMTSKFEKELESDFEGANQTLDVRNC